MNITVKDKKDLVFYAESIFMEALKKVYNESEDGEFDENQIIYLDVYIDTSTPFILDNFKIEYIDEFGGEGQGEEYYLIYKITETTSGISGLFKIDGYYSSYSGSQFDSVFEVQAEKKEITIYKEIK